MECFVYINKQINQTWYPLFSWTKWVVRLIPPKLAEQLDSINEISVLLFEILTA